MHGGFPYSLCLSLLKRCSLLIHSQSVSQEQALSLRNENQREAFISAKNIHYGRGVMAFDYTKKTVSSILLQKVSDSLASASSSSSTSLSWSLHNSQARKTNKKGSQKVFHLLFCSLIINHFLKLLYTTRLTCLFRQSVEKIDIFRGTEMENWIEMCYTYICFLWKVKYTLNQLFDIIVYETSQCTSINPIKMITTDFSWVNHTYTFIMNEKYVK